MSADWRGIEELRLLEGDVVDLLSAADCRAKAIDCMIRAETLDDPRQKTAMLQYAQWWNRLADYRADAGRDGCRGEQAD